MPAKELLILIKTNQIYGLKCCHLILLIFIVTLAVARHGVFAQDGVPIQFEAQESDLEILKKYKLEKVQNDSFAVYTAIEEVVNDLHSRGYLLAGFQDFEHDSTKTKISIHLGQQFKWAFLKAGNVEESLLTKTGYRYRFFENEPFRHSTATRIMQNIVKYAGENGFPFANIKLDSVDIQESTIAAVLNLNKGPRIVYDSIKILGTKKVKHSFLTNYLNVQPGAFFSEKQIDAIPKKINKLAFLKLEEQPQLSFQNSEATIYLNLEDKKVNQIDGFIGFLPNSASGGELLITGQFNMHLHNLFQSGKELNLEWKRIKPESQLLDIGYRHPNLLGSSLSVAGNFNLFKEDTSFNNRVGRIEIEYEPNYSGSFKFHTEFKSSRLLAVSQFSDVEELPDIADFNITNYGLEYSWNNLDDFFNPKRGLRAIVAASVGDKRIRKNAGIRDELYEDIDFRNVQYQLNLGVGWYKKVSEKAVLALKTEAGIIESESLFVNDLFRLGGLKSIRGFNQNFFLASQFAWASAEYRFYFEESSFFVSFLRPGLGRIRTQFVKKDRLSFRNWR